MAFQAPDGAVQDDELLQMIADHDAGLAPPSREVAEASTEVFGSVKTQDKELAELAERKFGGSHVRPVVGKEVLENLPDYDRSLAHQRWKTMNEAAAQGESLDELNAVAEKLRPRKDKDLPTGAAIIQFISAGTRPQALDSPALRIIRVYNDVPRNVSIRHGVSAMDYAQRQCALLETAAHVKKCPIAYYVVPTGTPIALPLNNAHACSEHAFAKGARNFQRAIDMQMELAHAVKNFSTQGSGMSMRETQEHAKHLDTQTSSKKHDFARRMQEKYERLLKLLEQKQTAAGVVPSDSVLASAEASSAVLDESGIPGGTRYPKDLQDDRQLLAHIAMGPDLDTPQDVKGTSVTVRAARGLEPWFMIFPFAYTSEEEAARYNLRIKAGFELRHFVCVGMYEWLAPLTFRISDADRIVSADTEGSGMGENSHSLGLEAVQEAMANRERIALLKETLLDKDVDLDEITLDMGQLATDVCGETVSFIERYALAAFHMRFQPLAPPA